MPRPRPAIPARSQQPPLQPADRQLSDEDRVVQAAIQDRKKQHSGKTMRFTGITILKVENGMITEEVGLDDGVSVLRQLGLIAEG